MDASQPVAVKLPRYIRIQVDEELSKADVRRWFKIVETYGPQNIISSVSLVRPKGGPAEVLLIHRKMADGKHIYDIPLKRDLTNKEIKTVLEQWNTYYDKDFLLETTQVEISQQREMLADAIVVKDDSYEKLCEAIAKSQHTMWMNERVQKGWRYGEKVNPRAKTHPMLRPWQELPEDYRKVDEKTPQMFIEELNRMGFTVVKTEELEDLMEQVFSR